MLISLKIKISKKKSVVILYWNIFLDFIKSIYLCFVAKFHVKKLIVISLYEHIGDITACEPVIKYLKERQTPCYIVWVLNKSYRELLKAHPDVSCILPINYFSEWIMLRKLLLLILQPSQVIDLHINGKKCSKFKKVLIKINNGVNLENFLDGKNLLQSFSRLAGLPELNNSPVFFIDKGTQCYELPDKYVIFHTSSNSSWKNWRQSEWEKLCREIGRMGYYVVEVGIKKNIQGGGNKYVDYTGKKSLQIIASIISGANLFIGLDSGFSHIANALNVNGVILLGQYNINGKTLNRYNPFSGNYALSSCIVYADNKPVYQLEYSEVIERIGNKLMGVHSNSSAII